MSNKNENEFTTYKSGKRSSAPVRREAAPERREQGSIRREPAPARPSAASNGPSQRAGERYVPRDRRSAEMAGADRSARRSAPARSAAPAFRKKKKKKWPIVLAIVLVLLLIIGGGAVFVLAQLGRIDRTRLGEIIFNDGAKQSGYRNIVIYGVDSRTGDMTSDTHSDTIMIASINEKTGVVKLASVYRDTYLDNTNGEYRKATECYFFGGPERSINMLNKNLDLDIEDFVTVDFACVIKIVDAVGGIDLEITDEEMNLINGYCVENKEVTGVDYTPLTTSGYVHLDGIQALAYCRIRYTEGWDFKRTERQRTVINLCFQKANQQGVSSLMSVANSLMGNIATSMSNTEIMGLVSNMSKYTLGEQTGFPFNNYPADVPGAGDCVVPVNLADNVSQLHAFLFGQEGYQPSDTVREISNTIINNTGIQ